MHPTKLIWGIPHLLCTMLISVSMGYAGDVYSQDSNESKSFMDLLWTEIYSETAYTKNNFSTYNPTLKEENYYISRWNSKFGLRFKPLSHNIFIDPYIKFDLVHDFGNKNWNKVYWNNNIMWGPGIRLSYEYNSNEYDNKDNFLWLRNFNISPFFEYLFIEDSVGSSKDSVPKSNSTNNIRSGVSSWFSIASKSIESLQFIGGPTLWGEMWNEFSYSSTDFEDKGRDNYYILYLRPTIGLKWDIEKLPLQPSVQPYYRYSFTRDFGHESWNKTPWLNNHTYGPGIRISFNSWKNLVNNSSSVRIFAEYLNIDYFSRGHKTDIENDASHEWKVGIEIWISLGKAKNRVYIQ